MNKQKKNIIAILILVIATIAIIHRRNNEAPYQKNHGFIFGTIYNITYQSEKDLSSDIKNELKLFDASLSPFNKESVITKVNQGKDIKLDSLFLNVYHKAMDISKQTNGAFDITVAPLVNAWGFGFKSGISIDSAKVDSLRSLVGYQKINLKDGKITKADPRIMLDCSAVAKGYASDVIAQLLIRKGIKNFMVEIGGEIVVKGINSKRESWRIGINKPVDDSLSTNQEIERIVQITNAGLATSGNYRNFYYKDGKKYAHTIDPRTGYPVQHSILSSTVIAKDCMTADALATAFMVMGLEESIKFIEAREGIEAYFIYSDSKGNNKAYSTKGMQRLLK